MPHRQLENKEWQRGSGEAATQERESTQAPFSSSPHSWKGTSTFAFWFVCAASISLRLFLVFRRRPVRGVSLRPSLVCCLGARDGWPILGRGRWPCPLN